MPNSTRPIPAHRLAQFPRACSVNRSSPDFTLVTAIAFLAASAALNRLTLLLSPLALVIVLGYSFAKRFTRWSHVLLGVALGIAPAAAWIAVRGTLDGRICILAAAVLLWVGGFDILYACQDYEHDLRSGLHSLPKALGLRGAFWAARLMHIGMIGLLCWVTAAFHLHWIAQSGVALVALLLLYEHSIIRPHDLRRMNAAFFLLNGVISMLYFASVAADILLR